MKAVFLALLLVCSTGFVGAAKEDEGANPMSTVIDLISDLQQKAIKEGEEAQKLYEEFSEFCEGRAGDLSHDIKTGKAAVEELKATIEEQSATIDELTTRIESVGSDASSGEADLKKATEVREKEHEAFIEEEKELMETVDMLKRAISVLQSSGASMLQVKNAGNLAQTFDVMVQASLIGVSDAKKLTAFVQAAQDADPAAGDEDAGAPAAAAYESKSGSIVETLEDLLDKAGNQLDEMRNKEHVALNNYELLKQSLSDGVHAAEKDMDDAKKGIAAASEKKSSAEGDLTVSEKESAADIQAKQELHNDCMSRSESFESEHKSRDAELEVLAKAKQIINENVQTVSLPQLSFLQLASGLSSGLSSSMELVDFKSVQFVRNLGYKHGSNALVQLASKMASTIRSAGGEDPFKKVKGMISDMVAKLEGEASAEATHKAYCDKELGTTKEKKVDTSEEVQELDTKVHQMESKTSKLKKNVAHLQVDITKLIKTHAEMDKLRAEDKEKYDETKAMIEKSITGLQMAIQTLKEYFSKDGASSSSAGAADSIISLLEDTESRMSAWMAELVSNEEAEVSEYKKMTQEDAADQAAKETAVGFKEKGIKKTAVKTTETISDEEAEKEELAAVSEYYDKVKKECLVPAESYEERTKRREAELAGLKEALEILEKEMMSLLQRQSSHKTLRGRSVQGAEQHRLIAA